jgi:hypothetical protein
VQIRENPLLERCRETLDAFGCAILTMRYEYVELAKITVANVLTELSESIDAGWAEIVPDLRLDRRIGARAYLDPGLGIARGNSSAISGPCSISTRERHRCRCRASLDWELASRAQLVLARARRATTANQGNAENWTTGGRLQGGHPVNEELGRPCLLA